MNATCEAGKEQFRQDMIRWLEIMDDDGDFGDLDTAAQGMPPLSVEGGVQIATAWARDEVLEDVASGRVPATVASFAELHDHVDANGYGGAFRWPCLSSDRDDAYQNEFCRFWNAVQENVNEWIASGRMKGEVRHGRSGD
jgi:hypothetical protein